MNTESSTTHALQAVQANFRTDASVGLDLPIPLERLPITKIIPVTLKWK